MLEYPRVLSGGKASESGDSDDGETHVVDGIR